jgi:hypothetical protein
MVSRKDIIKFIRCISRMHLNTIEKDYVLQFIKKEVPWNNLMVLADLNGVAGFVYYHLRNMELLHNILESALAEIEVPYTRIQKKNLNILSETKAIDQALGHAGIQAIALQGLSLITSVYNDHGIRQLGDMDLMVKPGNKGKFRLLLVDAGYRIPCFSFPHLLSKDSIEIDIHTHILNLDRIRSRRYIFPEDLTPMWERAVPFFEQHDGLLLPDVFDNFIALAAHALKHGYSRLIWLVDLQEIILKYVDNVDRWERIVERTRFWKQERVVLYALILMEELLGLKCSFRFKYELGLKQISIPEKHLLRLRCRGFSSTILSNTLWLANIKRVGDKLKFIRETIFPKGVIMAQIFPSRFCKVNRLDYIRRVINIIISLYWNLKQAVSLYFRTGRSG